MDSKKLKALVKQLAGEGALAWSWKKDESLVVIARNGEKRFYSAGQCKAALKKLDKKAEQKEKKEDTIG